MYLLDTNVVSEMRRSRPHGSVAAWMGKQPETSLFISAVSIGEIQRGIEITREQDAPRAIWLETWLEDVIATGNILAMDARAFRATAHLMHRRSGDQLNDAMIAATASVHGLTVVTRNVRDFERLGASVLDPFGFKPDRV